jgi:hypothetical protein
MATSTRQYMEDWNWLDWIMCKARLVKSVFKANHKVEEGCKTEMDVGGIRRGWFTTANTRRWMQNMDNWDNECLDGIDVISVDVTGHILLSQISGLPSHGSSTVDSERYSHQKRLEYPLLFLNFNQTWTTSTDFNTTFPTSPVMKIYPVAANLFHAHRQTDRQTFAWLGNWCCSQFFFLQKWPAFLEQHCAKKQVNSQG